MNEYTIIDSFYCGKQTVIAVIDRDFDDWRVDAKKAEIDGVLFDYRINTKRNWISILNGVGKDFVGKKVRFVKG